MALTHHLRGPLATAASLVVLTGCGADQGGADTRAAAEGEPVTVHNCGAEVTVDGPPHRVVLLKSAALPYLHEIGVLDRVVARAGAYPEEYYDDRTLAELERIETLTDELDSSGHLQISEETVLAQEPDLVLGEVENLSRATLAAVDVPLLEEPALCDTGGHEPAFGDIRDQLELYGEVFGREPQASRAADRIEERLTALRRRGEQVGRGRTAAVLYPTVGGGTAYAYGRGSMAHPQLEAAGFENVFADVDARVFEIVAEQLLGRDPDVLVLLHSEGDPAAVEDAVRQLPGAEDLTAVRDGALHTQLFNFTEPPSPLSIDGLELLLERFEGAR